MYVYYKRFYCVFNTVVLVYSSEMLAMNRKNSKGLVPAKPSGYFVKSFIQYDKTSCSSHWRRPAFSDFLFLLIFHYTATFNAFIDR